MLLFNALSMHTRLRSTMVSPREAQRAMGAGWANAMKAVDLVHTGSPTHTRVWITLVDLHFTFNSYQRVIQGGVSNRKKNASMNVNFFLILPSNWNILYYHHVYFNGVCRKHTCISWGAHTFVLINAIVTFSVFTGVAGTVIFIDLTVYTWRKIQWQTH